MNEVEKIKSLEKIIQSYEAQIASLFAQVAGLQLALARIEDQKKKEVRYP